MTDLEDKISQRISNQIDEINDIYEGSTGLKTSYSILFGAVIDSGLTREIEEAELFAKEAIQKLFLYGFYVFAVTKKRTNKGTFQFISIDHRYFIKFVCK